jgi:hypothetical protein
MKSKKPKIWKKKFKGTARGGAWIHTRDNLDRAIVENHLGFKFNGNYYDTLDDAKSAGNVIAEENIRAKMILSMIG